MISVKVTMTLERRTPDRSACTFHRGLYEGHVFFCPLKFTSALQKEGYHETRICHDTGAH